MTRTTNISCFIQWLIVYIYNKLLIFYSPFDLYGSPFYSHLWSLTCLTTIAILCYFLPRLIGYCVIHPLHFLTTPQAFWSLRLFYWPYNKSVNKFAFYFPNLNYLYFNILIYFLIILTDDMQIHLNRLNWLILMLFLFHLFKFGLWVTSRMASKWSLIFCLNLICNRFIFWAKCWSLMMNAHLKVL